MAFCRAPDEPVHVTLEFPDGTVYSGKCQMATINFVNTNPTYIFGEDKFAPLAGPSYTEIELVSYGDDLITFVDDTFEDKVRKERSSTEWRCWHCGRVNERLRELCASCNSPRPFVYR